METTGRRCSGKQGGFTVAEAIMVIALMSLLGLLAVPAITDSLSLGELRKATDALVNQVEFARYQASSRNRAYLLVVQSGEGPSRGRVQLHEGVGTVCAAATFQQDGMEPEPVLNVRDVDFSLLHSRVLIESVEPSNLDAVGFCFKPDGRVLRPDTGDVVAPVPAGYASGEAVISIRLLAGNGIPTDLSRRIVVPYNGIPRVE